MQPEKWVNETRRQIKTKVTKAVNGFLQISAEQRKHIIENIGERLQEGG
jgi:predicted metal-dependent RNase